jgi:hypothetical protein
MGSDEFRLISGLTVWAAAVVNWVIILWITTSVLVPEAGRGFEDKYYYGRMANGIYISQFRNVCGDKRDYLRAFGYQGGGTREGYMRSPEEITIGAGLKELLTEPGSWTIHLGGFGETLPYHENKLSLDKTRKDKWGLNVLAVDVEYKENERQMRADMKNDAMEMLTASGIKNVRGFDGDGTLGRGIHEMDLPEWARIRRLRC